MFPHTLFIFSCTLWYQLFLEGLLPNDMDGADMLSTLHTLYSMTFTAIGE